jgi:hypothetical protein
VNKLQRLASRVDGIFSVLFLDDVPRFFTLEHSFDLKPAVPAGTYTCIRGLHRLSKGFPFQTYEIMGVEGHSGILFHPGNTNADSEGCVLLGTGTALTGDALEVVNSRAAFAAFLTWANNRPSFELLVSQECS